MDEFDKPRLELLAKLAEQLASLQRECSELRRELDEHIKALEEQLRLNPAFCLMPDPNTEH
jgi:hypothetical protein